MEHSDLQVTEPIFDNSYFDRLREVYPDIKDITEMTTEEIIIEHEKMNILSNELMKKSQETTYKIHVGSHAMAGNILSMLTNHCDWTVSDAAVLISMINDFKEAKQKIDKEGFIYIRTGNITSLYQYLLKMKGNGYTSALNFLKILSQIGGSVSEAVKQIHDDNQFLKDVHTRLSTLDDEKDRRNVEGS